MTKRREARDLRANRGEEGVGTAAASAPVREGAGIAVASALVHEGAGAAPMEDKRAGRSLCLHLSSSASIWTTAEAWI